MGNGRITFMMGLNEMLEVLADDNPKAREVLELIVHSDPMALIDLLIMDRRNIYSKKILELWKFSGSDPKKMISLIRDDRLLIQ